MSTKSFGKKPVEIKDLTSELHQYIGANFPLRLTMSSTGALVGMQFDTTWKEGGTVAVEKEVTDEDGATIFNLDGTPKVEIDYEDNYVEKSLTAEQIAKLEKWAADNIK